MEKVVENPYFIENEIDKMLFQIIATSSQAVSRSSLSKETGLNKMTVGRHVSNLIEQGMIVENESDLEHGMGRAPISLHVSEKFPYFCGILIKRSYIQVVIADISGKVVNMEKRSYEEEMTADKLVRMVLNSYDSITAKIRRKILGCGIAALGPVDEKRGIILNPSDFWNIENVPIADILKEHAGVPVVLLHDANAGAVAERIYGKGKQYNNYIYLHIEEGIGTGYILNGKLMHDLMGNGGEIGHTSINFDGPKCSCGNRGCLEVYANVEQMRRKINAVLPYLQKSEFKKIKKPTWEDIVRQGAMGDMAAIAALDEFSEYLAHAIVNMLSLMNFPVIILGYDSLQTSEVLTKMIRNKIKMNNQAIYDRVKILSSQFGNAPLIGAVGAVVAGVFEQTTNA